jgi:hypothetical protein
MYSRGQRPSVELVRRQPECHRGQGAQGVTDVAERVYLALLGSAPLVVVSTGGLVGAREEGDGGQGGQGVTDVAEDQAEHGFSSPFGVETALRHAPGVELVQSDAERDDAERAQGVPDVAKAEAEHRTSSLW